jgi:hypothetical protein
MITNAREAHGLTGPSGEPLEGPTRLALEIVKGIDGYDFIEREPETIKSGAVSIVIKVPDEITATEHLASVPTGRKAMPERLEAAE